MDAEDTIEEFSPSALGEPLSHYSHVVRYRDLAFLSGCTALNEHGDVVGGDDTTAQTHQVFANLKIALASVGSDFGDVLKVTVYLTDVADRGAVNVVRQEHFGTRHPASTLICVAELAIPGLKVEIEAVARVRPNLEARDD